MENNSIYSSRYEGYDKYRDKHYEWMFTVILVITIALFISLGVYFNRLSAALPKAIRIVAPVKTKFFMEQKKEKTIVPIEKKIIEKRKKTIEQLQEKIQQHDKPQQSSLEQQPAPRKVYGIRRVYAKGIGAWGNASDALIDKIGNTLNKEIDSTVATPADLKGEVVSAASVSIAPKLKLRVKPEYTKEMLENRVEGIIKARILVDVDGKVKAVELLNDLGFGSARVAEAAFWKLEFEPALIGNKAVAVWIIVPIRFVLLGERE